jgi:uncharacterized membrane protein YgcG
MELIFALIAGGCILVAILIGIAQKARGSSEQNSQPSLGVGTMAAQPSGNNGPARRRRNRRGWQAPARHHFNDDDELVDDVGNIIIDLVTIASLCGEQYYPPEDAAPVEEASPEPDHSSSEPVASEVTPSTSFSDLQTDDSTRYSGGGSYSGGGYDGGGYDGGGGCDSGGGDCGGCDD